MILEPPSLDEGRHIGQKSIHSVCVEVEDVFNPTRSWNDVQFTFESWRSLNLHDTIYCSWSFGATDYYEDVDLCAGTA